MKFIIKELALEGGNDLLHEVQQTIFSSKGGKDLRHEVQHTYLILQRYHLITLKTKFTQNLV